MQYFLDIHEYIFLCLRGVHVVLQYNVVAAAITLLMRLVLAPGDFGVQCNTLHLMYKQM